MKNRTLLKSLLLAGMLFTATSLFSQVNISAGSTVTENFDGLGTSATATLPTGWKVDKNTTVRSVGTYSAAVSKTEQRAGNSMASDATNGIYNFGAGVATSATDRAIGGISSSSASKSVNVYVQLTNNGTTSINNFTIGFDVEKYRNGKNSAGFTIQMYYSTNGSTWTTAGDAFKVSFPADPDNSGFSSAPGSTTSVTGKTLSQSLAAGASLYLAWNYSVTSGSTTSNAQALGIDNVSIKANGTSNPALSATTLESFGNVAVGTTAGPKSFTLTGSNLTGNVTVGALTGFTYSTTETGTYANSLTLTPSSGSINQTIYVKFTPTAVQSYNGNITISSQGATSINVAAQGSGILAAPTATAATSVSATGFTANWNAVTGATGYKLNVYTKTGTTNILSEDFSKFTAGQPNGNAHTTDISDNLNTYTLVSGWTGSKVFQAGGTVKVGSNDALGSLVTPALDLTGEVTLSFKAMAWSGDATELKIYLDNVLVYTQTGLNNTDYTFNSYSITLTGGTATSKIKFEGKQATKGRFFLDDITITKAGQPTPISGSPFTISGGSNTSYTLSGLATNTTYYYTVKATDGSNTSASSNEISVELSSPSITVTPEDPLSFATNTGLTASKTITVSGLHLTSDIMLSVSNENVFSVSPTSLTRTNGTVSETEITITYHPTVSGTHTGTLTISSTGATTVEIALSGTATPLPVVDIVSLNEDGTFNMDWNTTGTLHVYEKVTDGSGNAEGLFFSKYFEADGNNKLLEIFNGTANDVSLNGWKVQVFQIGKREVNINWDSTNVMTYALSGTLEKRKSYVLYTKDVGSSCSGSFGSDWHQFSSPNELLFNGNDPIRLVDNNNNIVDIIGQSKGKTPTERWTATKTDGTELKTDRQLLVRNISVISGTNAVSNDTTSFATLGTEWDLYPMDYSPGQPIACNALIEFGNYDYGNIYTTWQEITNAVSNKKVTIPNAAARPCEELKVEVKNGETVTASSYINVPIIVSDAKNIDNYTTLCPTCDMGIKSGGKLTVNEANKSIRNVTVFPNGKLDINQSVTMRNLTLKAGLGNNLYDDFPTSTLKINSNGQIVLSEDFRYVRTLDDVQWYFIAFPFDVSVSSITAADGSLGTLGTNWFLKYYDGASRVQNLGATSNWKTFTGSTLEAGKGYIIGLASGTKEIIFPMGHYITLSPETSKSIAVTYYGKDAINVTENHKGWNLIGNPFFGKLNGSAANFNYFTFSDGGSSKTYTQVTKELLSVVNPFTSFFVQAGSDLESSGISFNVSGLQLLPASVRNETSDKVRITYQSPTGTDETTLILDDQQTAAYEIGEDLEKWVGTGTSKPQVYTVTGGINYAFNALSYAEAQNLPLAVYTKTSGSHTFHAVASQSSTLAELTLTDKTAGKSVNLLTSDYTYSATAGTNTTRFLISARRVISSTLPQEKGNNLVVFSTNGKIVVDGLSVNSLVRVFDITGKPMAIVSAAVADKLEIPLSVAGVYQVVVESPNQIRRTIKIMHYPSR